MYLCNIYNKSKYNDYITIVLTYSDTNPAFFFFLKKNLFFKSSKKPSHTHELSNFFGDIL